MSSRDLIDRASILSVWSALGGGSLRHGRGAAFWRDGNSNNIALDESKGCWFDHAHGKGGGILDLIQTALVCDRRESLRWLAGHLNVSLDNQPLSRTEKREYAQWRSLAEFRAKDLTKWRRDILKGLRVDRNRLYVSENANAAVARILLLIGSTGDEGAWNEIWQHALDNQQADAVDARVQHIESATPAELAAMRHESSEAA